MNLSKVYRPTKFDDILAQDDSMQVLRSQVSRKRIGSSYLFSGPSGTGKTTTARVLSMAVNCDRANSGNPCLKCAPCQSIMRGASYDVLEFDVGSYRGIDDIKHIEMTTKYMPFGKYKVYILDEVHALTATAWDAALKMLEDCNDYMLFILCTSQPEKIPEVARSRCQEFRFHRLDAKTVTSRLVRIAQSEKFPLDYNALKFVAEFSEGNMRTAEMLLTQVMGLNHGKPSPKQIRKFMQSKII